MQRWGKTTVGTTRWRCLKCKISRVRYRRDNEYRKRKRIFENWLLGNSSLKEISIKEKVTDRNLRYWFEPFWENLPKPKVMVPLEGQTLIIDGIYLHKRTHAVLIGRTKEKIVFWLFADRENFFSWLLFFSSIQEFPAVTCDGQKGMILALETRWKSVVIQRCIFHLVRLSLSKLTMHPKTVAGQKLRLIIKSLSGVHTKRQKRRWLRKYFHWEKQYSLFIKERTRGEKLLNGKQRWWYTHRSVRTVKTMIKRSLPNLFSYIGHPNIPRSTNHVEGGINARLKELLHRHRGLSMKKKQILATVFLSKKQG